VATKCVTAGTRSNSVIPVMIFQLQFQLSYSYSYFFPVSVTVIEFFSFIYRYFGGSWSLCVRALLGQNSKVLKNSMT